MRDRVTSGGYFLRVGKERELHRGSIRAQVLLQGWTKHHHLVALPEVIHLARVPSSEHRGAGKPLVDRFAGPYVRLRAINKHVRGPAAEAILDLESDPIIG